MRRGGIAANIAKLPELLLRQQADSGTAEEWWRLRNVTGPERPRAMTIRKVIVLGCVLTAIAITLKVRLDTPQGPQPLARALITTHLQQLRGDLALP
jgi:hypothetical protein